MFFLIISIPQYSYGVREAFWNSVGFTEAHLKFLFRGPGNRWDFHEKLMKNWAEKGGLKIEGGHRGGPSAQLQTRIFLYEFSRAHIMRPAELVKKILVCNWALGPPLYPPPICSLGGRREKQHENWCLSWSFQDLNIPTGSEKNVEIQSGSQTPI